MSDAQAEAEWIVDGILGPRHVVEALSTMVGMDADDEPRDRLVAALAAAIEETQAEGAVDALRMNTRAYGKNAAVQRLNGARQARREALSALRQTDGEDA